MVVQATMQEAHSMVAVKAATVAAVGMIRMEVVAHQGMVVVEIETEVVVPTIEVIDKAQVDHVTVSMIDEAEMLTEAMKLHPTQVTVPHHALVALRLHTQKCPS